MDISPNSYKIDFLYRLALEEGEGWGTAYEYFVKMELFYKLLKKNRIQRILMAGLPEKYGFSLDIFLFSKLLGSELLVVDTDVRRLDRLRELLNRLDIKKILPCPGVTLKEIGSFSELADLKSFDLSISSSIAQQLSEDKRRDYLSGLFNISHSAIIFAPNVGNEGHAKITGLNAMSISDLAAWRKLLPSQMVNSQHGLLDMPPFPPGIKLKRSAKDATQWQFKMGAKALEIWSGVEDVCPYFIKNKMAHIVYLFASEKNKE